MVKWLDGQSKAVKIIFAIPFISIVWVIYRIIKSSDEKNTLGVVLGILLIFVTIIPILWLVDMITILLKDKVLWF